MLPGVRRIAVAVLRAVRRPMLSFRLPGLRRLGLRRLAEGLVAIRLLLRKMILLRRIIR